MIPAVIPAAIPAAIPATPVRAPGSTIRPRTQALMVGMSAPETSAQGTSAAISGEISAAATLVEVISAGISSACYGHFAATVIRRWRNGRAREGLAWVMVLV